MKTAARPENESDRLAALHEYRILGTKPEQSYDDITTIASETCQTPIALLSLVDADRQWFKSRVGLDVEETPRDWSFCAHAILSSEPLIVPDAHCDQRFKDNPLVAGDPGIRLYAGFPLQNDEDHRIGTLCVIDRRPRDLNPVQCKVMEALARQAVSFLELRKRSIKLLDAVCQMENKGGMISTCSYCRKAKDDRGHWLHLDQYLSQHTTLNFSHGICDACMETHFPEVVDLWDKQGQRPSAANEC